MKNIYFVFWKNDIEGKIKNYSFKTITFEFFEMKSN